MIPHTKLADQYDIHGTFILSHFLTRVLFKFGCIKFIFVIASRMKGLGLEVKILEKSSYVSSPLGTRVSVGLICQGCELEISRILLIIDLRVMKMSELNVILGMDWLIAHQVIINCDRKRVSTYIPNGTFLCFKGISIMLYPDLCTTLDGMDN